MNAAELALDVREVSYAYGSVQALTRVSLTVPKGRFLGLIGPNGSGKSTLVDCVSGFASPRGGSIRLFGQDISGWPAHRVARAGLVRTFQVCHPFGRLTVMSGLMVAPSNQEIGLIDSVLGRWRRRESVHVEAASTLLRQLSLGHVANSYAGEISGGQQRLAELGRAMMAVPQVLVLDEPFAGVSPGNRGRLADEIFRLRDGTGLTVLMIEHRLEYIDQLCDSVVVLAEGQKIAEGPMSAIRANKIVADVYLGDYAALEDSAGLRGAEG